MPDRRLTILNVLPKLDTGGAERVVVEIAGAITATGHRALIACEAGGLTPAALRAGAEIIEMPLSSKSPFTIRANAKRLAKLMAARDVCLVHAHSRAPAWAAQRAAARMKVPFVTTYHGAYSEGSAIKRRYNEVMVRGDRVIAVSHYIADLIAARYKIDDAKLRTIPGGVDTARFDPAIVVGDRVLRLAREWRLDMSRPTIMLPGRLTSWKGHKLLIEAMARLRHRDAVAVLVGSDQGRTAYTEGLIAHANQLGLGDRLRIVGHTDDMPAAMMLADIVVNASTEPEAFGRTIIEAQAMGRIVIAADHGGACETIVPLRTGYLFPPGDEAGLAARIDQALDMDAQARIAWGRYARAYVAENYAVETMQGAVLDVYAELLT
jgi:glycosyltransferase involved in cell wall biosynthesis